jgi:SlyX protein
MNSDALEQVETKIAFLEHANAELSDVVTRQQRDIDVLRDQVAALASRIEALRESDATPRTAEEERPPHY